MAEKKDGRMARGSAKKAGSRTQAPPQGARQKASASKSNGRQGAPKKAASRKGAAPRAAAKKAGSERRASPEERHRLIQQAAYFKAEKEGFTCDPATYWLVAEAEVDAQLARSRSVTPSRRSERRRDPAAG
jgi:hypothetical protein